MKERENIKVKVDKNVPVPTDRAAYGEIPIKDLEVGESIVFPATRRSGVQSNASRVKKATGKEFTIRKVNPTDCRIWRTK